MFTTGCLGWGMGPLFGRFFLRFLGAGVLVSCRTFCLLEIALGQCVRLVVLGFGEDTACPVLVA
ncbi:hypothetical protein ACFR99_08740 [Haloarchaeobius amylolyticus]|uniref:Secreted protein n=1 Tax=Haloarchaeobius amylolyticus TaxID=1198296 RepID=A0ABD6BEX9_9EURY